MDDLNISFTWPSAVPEKFGTDLVDEISRLARSARNEIIIYAFSLNLSTDFFLQPILKKLLQSKVNVSIYCDDVSTATDFSDLYYDWREHINIHYWKNEQSPNSKFHLKIIAVDKKKLYIGSANLSKIAMEGSAECGIFIESIETAEKIHRYVSSLKSAGLIQTI